MEIYIFVEKRFFPPKTNMTMENNVFLVGDTSSNGCGVSIVMLVFLESICATLKGCAGVQTPMGLFVGGDGHHPIVGDEDPYYIKVTITNPRSFFDRGTSEFYRVLHDIILKKSKR